MERAPAADFLEQNRSWQAAAGTLPVHKTSLTYRIRRINELTGRRSATPPMWLRCGWPCRRRISSGTRGRTAHHPSDDRETVYRLLWS
ncbi:helix-turn-helix domain-containing protein [Falsirhodobacter xinxiangensis]|uniref:helix-turn-helix domain-containing protein n=1 Tax=Falsirhodobacter xinxiangensis TaxID=2530049 RepID=UPI0010AB33EB